jgi:hypothetical protein
VAAFNLFIDCERRKAVLSANDSSAAGLPPFVQQDSLQLKIWLLTGYSRLAAYSKVAVAGITLEVALGTKQGGAAAYYTTQFTWVPSDDLGQPYFSGTLSMATAEIAGLLGSAASANAWFHIRKIEGGTPTTILEEPVTIHAAVIKSGALEVPAPLTPMSAESANATYVKQVHYGVIDLMNANGKGTRMYTDEDGAFRTDPITP